MTNAERCAAYYQANKERIKPRHAAYSRLRNSGFTAELTDCLRRLQLGKCAMPDCGVVLVQNSQKADGECADHDHVTGKPRGLLCRECNKALGFYEKLRGRAEQYLANTPASYLENRS